MVFIYVKQITPRIDFTFKLIFNYLLGIDFKCIHSIDQFSSCTGAKLSYAHKPIENEPFVYASDFLFSLGTEAIIPGSGKYNDLPILFSTTQDGACLPFDLFSATFFLVSRYEEYQPKTVDQHNRFKATESIAYKHDFLHLPIVNLWINAFKDKLTQHFPDLCFKSTSFHFVPTYDIDHAWAFKNKGTLRNLLQITRQIITLNFKQAKRITQILQNKENDPYDTFSHITKITRKHAFSPIFFFLLGNYGKYDKNVSTTSERLKSLVQSISKEFSVGIHPSYKAHLNPNQLIQEQRVLQKFTGSPVTKSRQHYLRLTLPESYQLLIEQGITDDYTMGYADYPGFRAGIAHPFSWYDLSKETETTLTIHPFQFMDVTLRNYRNLSPAKAKETIKQLIDATIDVNGQLISLWHNSSFSSDDGWDGWEEVHDFIFEQVARHLNTSD